MGHRTSVLCVMGFAALLSTGCMLDRSATGTCAPGPCGDAGLLGDAWVGDGDVHDAGHDAFVADGGDANLPDAPDAFMPPLDGGMDAGSDAGSDAGTDGGTDGGPPPVYLHFRYDYTGSTTVRGFAFRVAWNPGPMSSIWYMMPCDSSHATDTGSAVVCDADVPELMATRTVDLYPVNGTGTSVCSTSACPGVLTDWSFTYGGAQVPGTEITIMTGLISPGPTIPGDTAYIRIGHLPIP